MSQQIEKAEIEAVPKSWPGPFGVYRYSKAAVLFNWKTLLGLLLLGAAASILLSLLDPAMYSQTDGLTVSQSPVSAIVNLVMSLVSVLLSISAILVILSNINRVQIRLVESLKQSLGYFVKYLLMAIVLSAITFVSLLLFIIPFFFVMPRISLAPYFLVDQKLGPIESIKASWNATRGHATKVWGIILATFLMALLMITIIGIPFSIYFLFMYSAAYTLLYKYVTATVVEAEVVEARV